MSKSLSDMTLEELWALFPILLVEHKECWTDWYLEEEMRLNELLQIQKSEIYHIGSTAIKNIWAKPIVDILVQIPFGGSMEEVKQILTSNGYSCMSEEVNRKSFNLGYTKEGFAERVFHLHLRYFGDGDELYFRDYLNDNPILAKEYEELKLNLWRQFEHNRDAYTNAKGSFIREYTECAKKQYGKRYDTNIVY